MFKVKRKYLLSLILIVPVLTIAQNINISHNQLSSPDTSEYEIIYEVDTIHQTKTIIEHDTIYQFDSSTKIADTAKHFSPNDSSKLTALIAGSNKNQYFLIDLLFSPFIYSNKLTAINSSENTAIDYRNAYEKPQTSYSISLTPEYKINRWSIQSGVQYSLLKNKYSYPYQGEKNVKYKQDSSYTKYINDTITSYEQIYPDSTVWRYVIDKKLVTVNDSISKNKTVTVNQIEKGIQYSSFIEVPLIFGYQFMHYKKLSFDLKTGVITSFIVYRKGEIVSFSNGIQTFINLSAYPYVTTSFSGYLGLNINYELSKSINIEVLPYFQEGYSSLLQKKSSMYQSLERKGVSLGLKYKF